MQKMDQREKWVVATVILLLLAAVICRHIQLDPSDHLAARILGLLRVGIYIGLAFAWALSIRRRILSAEVKRYLLLSAALIIFWLTARAVRFNLPKSMIELQRYCWYCYYIPMLFIPLLGVFAAACINRPEEYRLPRGMKLLTIPAFLMIAAVLTNDLHQLAFVFPCPAMNGGSDYSYGPVYFAAVLLIAAETAAFITLLLKKSRLPGKGRRLLLPLLPPFAGFLYTAAYFMHIPYLRQIAGDVTAVFCLIMVSTYEACIYVRLIPSNTHYDKLFRSSTIAARITDEAYGVLYASDADMSVCTQSLRQTENGSVMLPGNIRLSGAPITGGHVVWQEDMTELVRVLDELRDTKENLEGSNDFMREENELKTREAHIAEQDRLYSVIQRDTKDQIELLVKLTDEFEQTDDEGTRKRLLGKMAVVGAYIKRRSNLILSGDKTPFLSTKDIALTFGESIDNLVLYGVYCALWIKWRGMFLAKHIMAMYDLFEEVAERFDMSVLTAVIDRDGEWDCMTLNTDSAADLTALQSDTVAVLRDADGEWQLKKRLSRGGKTL